MINIVIDVILLKPAVNMYYIREILINNMIILWYICTYI